MKRLPAFLCLLCFIAGAADFVTYEAFGAKGDGTQNDGPAIVRAHQYANEHHLPVRAADGRTYRIGSMTDTAIIRTDTDWGKARFIIDDRDVFKCRRMHVFRVDPSRNAVRAAPPAGLKRGAASIGTAPGFPALVLVENSQVRQFIRKGANKNAGSVQQEILLADARGNIDPSTPLLWDYGTVTKMTLFPLEEKPLTLRGGHFTTIANGVADGGYYARGIVIQRSRVKVSGIRHEVTEEGDKGSPYSGFIVISRAAFVTVEDSVFCGHKYYRIMGRGGSMVAAGSYDLNAIHSCSVTWRRCVQSDSIHDKTRWGIFGSNFCRNLRLENCTFSRFDAHQGVANAELRNCRFGYQGVSVTGFGTLLMEECEVTASQMIHLRPDYGSFWRGKIIVRDTKFRTQSGTLFWGSNDGKHDFGYPCMMPEEIVLENVLVENKGAKNPAFLFGGFQPSGKDAPYPYQLCRKCTLHRVTASNRKRIQTAAKNPEMFRKCRFARK